MKRPVETAQMTLVTIIAELALQDRLLSDLKALGATGYTFASVDGRGRPWPEDAEHRGCGQCPDRDPRHATSGADDPRACGA